jgi:hypothetical protein
MVLKSLQKKATHQNAIQSKEDCQFVTWVYHKATAIDILAAVLHLRLNASIRQLKEM